jgi:TatD DNase family protein
VSPGRHRDLPPPPEPLPAAAVDSHCHLDAIDTAGVEQTLAASRAAGISRVVTVGDTIASSQWCAQAAMSYGGVRAAVAVHPNEVAGITEEDYAELDRLAALPQVGAVGETGLDYYWDRVQPAAQQEAFRRHIDLAKRHGKALVVHDREAHDDVLRVLDEESAPERTVFHCFSGDAAMARLCLDRGYILSFAGTVTFTNAPQLREAARLAPAEQLLAETDAPFLTPHPFRGRPNSPAMVALTVRCLAAVRHEDLGELCASVSRTADRVFGAW